MKNEPRKSDSLVVPAKLLNKTASKTDEVAEGAEGRGLVAGNLSQQNTGRTQSREGTVHSALERVREVAKKDKRIRFTALMHHIYDGERLRQADEELKRDASPGIDGETWRHYGERLEENLQDLSSRLRRGAYRAKPVRRMYITKEDGRQRPLGVPALEDKIVQRATIEVLNAIYETDFLGFSYGFRPGRSQHRCLDALYVGLLTKKVNWVLDADIRGFFDRLNHEWLVKFVEHRIADPRVVRLVQKWLRAGVLEEGKWLSQEEGTPQGGSASPLLANLYLHYVLDLWIHRWRRTQANGEAIVVRWADDFVVGFENQSEAEQCLFELKERFRKFGLELHPEKTRLIEFGRYAAQNRERRGLGSPETFNFLGFTHICATRRKTGKFTVWRKTIKKRFRAKLQGIRAELRKRKHESIPEGRKWLSAVLVGHFRYYGVPDNSRTLRAFRQQVVRHWYRTLRRRSQKTRLTWNRMARLANSLPPAILYHSYPSWAVRV